ncbi:arrestin domain-containing protein 17-like [Lineus longissimus]|uniref:arrestin domain-containing protein 17-like n=1 Tax=Lineus longissimus TaxID=88925 RepID=UPI00315DFFA5
MRIDQHSGTMGRITKLDIQLDHDIDAHYHFRPGENISGKVLVRVIDGEEILRYLRINFFGMGSVSWKDELAKTFSAEETYINQTVTLAPLVPGEKMVLPSGWHEFSFSYELPLELPSSFIGKFGSVTYVVKASAEDGKTVTISSEPFLIANKDFPFSAMMLNESVERTVSKRYWSKYRTGKVTAKLSLKRQGFAPGDDMDINAEIHNHSPKIIKGLHAMLIMHSTFYAQNSNHTHVQVISKRNDKWEMARGEGRHWSNAELTIPTYAPESKLEGCDIIDIHYELVLKVEIETKKETAKELWVSVPVLVTPVQSQTENGVRRRQRSQSEMGRTIDRKTLESLDIQKLLDLQQEYEDTEFGYSRPVNDGTLRINPLFRQNTPEDHTLENDLFENTKL